jgi:DNA-binding transcriptional regulator YiaG
MQPRDFQRARERLGLTREQMAQVLEVYNARTVHRWEVGERAIPGPVRVLVSAMVASRAVRVAVGLGGQAR